MATSALSRFQDAFARALREPAAPELAEVAALAGQPAFAVYRNTVIKGCIDALQSNYPAVTRLVGEEWFRGAASVFVRENLPAGPVLLEYGNGFPDFLARFEPAADLPWLPDVARLDRYWTEAHIASDAPGLDAETLGQLSPDALGGTAVRPHPAARWAWFATAPVYTIWSRNRALETPEADIDWQAEGALLTRPGGEVEWAPMGEAGCVFLDACAAGDTLATAAHAALAVDSDADLAQLMASLLRQGAFRAAGPTGLSSHKE